MPGAYQTLLCSCSLLYRNTASLPSRAKKAKYNSQGSLVVAHPTTSSSSTNRQSGSWHLTILSDHLISRYYLIYGVSQERKGNLYVARLAMTPLAGFMRKEKNNEEASLVYGFHAQSLYLYKI